MKAPRYPLEAVVEQREAAKQEARLGLAESLRALEREEQVLRRREGERDALVADADARRGRLYEPDPAGLLDMASVTRRTDELRHVEGRRDEAERAVEDQRQALVLAERRVEVSRSALVDADRELRAVEKHRERWLEEWRRRAARKEQRQAEEVVTARFATDRAGGDEGEQT